MKFNLKFKISNVWNESMETILNLVEKIKERHPNNDVYIEVTFENQ